jgi:hypothetical protein
LPNPLLSVVTAIRSRLHETVYFLTEIERVRGVSPAISFKTMTNVYLGDLATRASIDFLADLVAGQGFYTTHNEEYQEKSEGKTAKEIVDEFCEEVGLDEVLQESARYLIGWGNVFWWVGSPVKIEFLRPIPLEIIKDEGIKYDFAKGAISKVIFDWKQEPQQILGEEIIHLAYNVLTAKPLGVGILQSLCTPLDIGDGDKRDAYYQIKGRSHDSFTKIMEKFGAPVELWSVSGASEKSSQQLTALLKNMPREGARIVVNPAQRSEAKVQPVVPETPRGIEKYLEILDDEYLIGLQSPISNLLGKTGFKYATAKAAVEVVENRVMAFQRFLKRGVERHLFDKVVGAAGLDPKQAQVRLNWGMPESLDYEKLTQILGQLTELLKVVPGVVSDDELRKILRDVAKLPLEKEESEAKFISRVLVDKKPIGEGNESIPS